MPRIEKIHARAKIIETLTALAGTRALDADVVAEVEQVLRLALGRVGEETPPAPATDPAETSDAPGEK